MANCKGCIHQCYTEVTEEACNFFVDKTKYVEVVLCKDCASKVHDNASDEDWCNNPDGLCCRLEDHYFCPFGTKRVDKN